MKNFHRPHTIGKPIYGNEELYEKTCHVELHRDDQSWPIFSIFGKCEFLNACTSNRVQFNVIGRELVATLGAQITFQGGLIGEVQITYFLKDKMYQAKRIEFKPGIRQQQPVLVRLT
jgi:hypothetical protein